MTVGSLRIKDYFGWAFWLLRARFLFCNFFRKNNIEGTFLTDELAQCVF